MEGEINMKKNNTSVVLVVSILLSFVCGIIGAYIITGATPVKESIVKNIRVYIANLDDVNNKYSLKGNPAGSYLVFSSRLTIILCLEFARLYE